MAGKKSLSDLGALTGQEPETPAVAETTAAETATVEAPAADAVEAMIASAATVKRLTKRVTLIRLPFC